MRQKNKKPRGMMIIHNFRPGPTGGAELQAERLAEKLVERGHDMQLLTRLTVPEAPLEETSGGLRIHRTPFPLAYGVTRGVHETFRYLVQKQRTYDVLHCHMAFGHAVVAVVIARCFRKQCIVKIACAGEFGDLFAFSKFERFPDALQILYQADRIIAVSRVVEKELLDYGFPPDRILIIPNGVDTQAFSRQRPFPERGRRNFILVGRRHPQKGIDTALQATKLLVERGFQDRFGVHFYGMDYPEYDYQKMAAELGIAPLVELLPFDKGILDIYHSAHCLLLPSRGEGLSNTLLEAMAMELPVIATGVSGTDDVVESGRDGVLIPPDSPESLANAMATIIQDPDLGLRLGKCARLKVESQFSLDSVAQRYSALYGDLCGRRSK
jgi:L-malate glycosyltransferase